MATTNGNRKILDLKRWEWSSPAPAATSAGAFVASSRHYRQQQLYVASATVAYLYNPNEDGWVLVPSPALAGSFGAGAAGVAGSFSTGTTTAASSLTAASGTTTSITIPAGQTINRDLRGYSVYFVGGTGAGKLKTIARNTAGSGATITFEGAAEAVAFDNTSQFRLKTPVWYVLSAGTLASGSFKKYDFATNTWTTLSITGAPASLGTDGKLISTPAWVDDGFQSFATGTATAGTSTTISNSAKTWTTNQWTNYQIRISSGTGAGQIRTVSSNTGTQITVSAAWTTTPDATSVYSIEGNDDFVYYIGNNASTMYRYSISGNSWSTISPVSSRGGTPGAGASAHWVWEATEPEWTDESNMLNGRYIFSFRGNGAAGLDRYDIAANTWAVVDYAPTTEVFSAGTKYAYKGDFLYIQKDATGRWMRYSFPRREMDGWNTMLTTQGAAVAGDTAFDVTYRDGATEVVYIHMLLNTSTIHLRQMII